MKRITATLPDNLAERLKTHAQAVNASRSEIVRRALAEYLVDGDESQDLPFIGIARSAKRWDASRFDEILAETFADDIRKSFNR